MKKRIGNVFGLLAAGVLAAVLLTGCGAQAPGKVATGEMKMEEAAHDTAASASGSMGNYYEGGTELAPMEEAPQVTTMEASAESAALKDRKLIKTVDMSVETKEFDSLMASLERKVEELGGYIESLEVYNGRMYSYDSTSRDASLTLRIPQNKLTDFLNEVSEISNVIHRSERVEDVTLTYVDMESHWGCPENGTGQAAGAFEEGGVA